MCWCDPNKRTPNCGAVGCVPPQVSETSVVADEGQTVVDDLTATNKSTLEERALTEDEARAQVCRSTAAMLAASVKATQEELEKAKGLGQDGPAEETGRRIVKAAQELGLQLINQARKLDRPRILRPERSLRILRRH